MTKETSATREPFSSSLRGLLDEALVSQTVRDLVAGSDLAFEEPGTHALKGLSNEWRLSGKFELKHLR